MRLSLRFPRSALFLAAMGVAILTGGVAPARAQTVALKDAFPGLTFKRPVYFGEMAGAATQTFVILEQHIGQVTLLIKKDGKWTASAMLTKSVHQANEMGLMGIAFHPDFKNNKKYYINYDPPGTFFNIIEERMADETGLKDAGDSKSRILIKQSDKYDNHNGGTMAFGPKDGFLYIGMGDGGSGGDPDGNGQNKNVLLGKMLRIDVNRKDAGLEYGIPSDNPFAQGGGRGEIYAYGFRNPWKWSFDAFNGDLWMGDVGQDAAEEVDIVTKGGNFGWDSMEGFNGTNSGGMILPIHTYAHASNNNCILGGVVYRGNPASPLYGTYFFADHGSKRVWNLKKNGSGQWAATQVATAGSGPTGFGTDSQGLVYLTVNNESAPIYLLDSPDLGPSPTSLARPYKVGYRPEWKGLRWEMNGRRFEHRARHR